jgi:hypothetical protein
MSMIKLKMIRWVRHIACKHCHLGYEMLLFGGEVCMPLKKQAAFKTVYPEVGGTICLQNHSTYLLSYMASQATTIRTSNISTKL